ncbi:MAG: ECF-type sigma factor [Phycisphaerae bacterium]
MSDATITELVRQSADGRKSSVNRLLPLVYDELRALAQHLLEQERAGHSLQATALVNEAYLKLVDQTRARYQDRAHFFAVAAQAIRRILIDHARARGAAKRGGDWAATPLDANVLECGATGVELLALEDALAELERLSERQARIVEMRFFAGLSIDEVAAALSTSARTIDGEWAMARAWLRRRMSGAAN